ncbi:MAG: hypothetical protein R6U52_01295 [Kosmotogaceae bacterium]
MNKKTFSFLSIIIYFIGVTYVYFIPINLEKLGTNTDKKIHYVIFLCGGLLFLLLKKFKTKKVYLTLFLSFLLVSPFLLEIAQGLVSYRVYDPKDMLANYLGLGTVLLVYLSIKVIKKIIFACKNET